MYFQIFSVNCGVLSAGKKRHFDEAHPAKISRFGNPRKHLLTIPTYLRERGREIAHLRRLPGATPLADPPSMSEPGHFMAAAKAKQAEAELDEVPEDEEGEQPAAKPKRKLPSLEGDHHRRGRPAGARRRRRRRLFLLRQSRPRQAGAGGAKPAIFVDLPDVLVNLSNAGTDRTQYLKVKIVLELPDAKLVPQIQPLMPRVMDAFQTYLRELRPTDLDGSAGLYRLKEELTRRVNAAIAPNRINAVLFKEIVVQ